MQTMAKSTLFTIVLVALSASASMTTVNLGSRAIWSDQVISAHNDARAEYGADALTWNEDMYIPTLQWSQTCIFQHSNETTYGETLYASMAANTTIGDAVKTWIAEAANYDYETPEYSENTGNFTQVVWKSTTQVACTMANCPGGSIFLRPSKYIVCRYTPPGNITGGFAENVGQHEEED
ncbi:extracellular SCP domain-containing protein Pry1 [Cyathus striatus]|nr:extracellular SCP domain-containing protein Pry1 [Cyathus striatus]